MHYIASTALESPLHQTLHLAQCSQTSTVLLAAAKPRLLHQIARWRSVIGQSGERVSTALESSGGEFYTTMEVIGTPKFDYLEG